MFKVLSVIQKKLVWFIPLAMMLGFLFGNFFNVSNLKMLIVPVTFLMIYPMMVTLNLDAIFKKQNYKLQIITQLINFILVPALAFYLGRYFFSGVAPEYALWAVGLFLIGVLPTSGMTISWTGFAKGNKEAATVMVVLGLVVGSVLAPIYVKSIMGATINVDMLHMFKQIGIFVFIPLVTGITTQKILLKKYGKEKWNKSIKLKFPPFAAIGVVLIAFLAISLKAKSLVANPDHILKMVIPLFAFYLFNYVFLTIVGKLLFKREDAVAMVFGVVMRDLSIALAIAITAFGKEGSTVAVIISLAYVLQMQTAAWYIKSLEFFENRNVLGYILKPVKAIYCNVSVFILGKKQKS